MMRIVSGGQSGVDRAALDVAMEKSIPYRGWCPKGGWAEDLPHAPGLLLHYRHLQETPDADPSQRTEWNVRDSDRLLVLIDSTGLKVSKGTEAALEYAVRLGKPHIVIDLDERNGTERTMAWLKSAPADMSLCIAGPRESEAPGIYVKAKAALQILLAYKKSARP